MRGVLMINIISYLIAFCYIIYFVECKSEYRYVITGLLFVRIFWYFLYQYEYITDMLLYFVMFYLIDIIICILILSLNITLVPKITAFCAIILLTYQLLFLFDIRLYNKCLLSISDYNLDAVFGTFKLGTKIRNIILFVIITFPYFLQFII